MPSGRRSSAPSPNPIASGNAPSIAATVVMMIGMIAVLAEFLTAAEARQLAAFYRSAIGRKLLAGASTAYRRDAAIASALRDKDVSEADLRAAFDAALARVDAKLAELQALRGRIVDAQDACAGGRCLLIAG